jgi:FdhD protein
MEHKPFISYPAAETTALDASYQDTIQAEVPATVTREVRRYVGSESRLDHDLLAVEEPLQIRLAGEDVALAMRTPGHDEELALGFLYTEGIIGGLHHVQSVARCLDEDGLPSDNTINVTPTDRALLDPSKWRRDFYAASSCGLCGKTSITQIARHNGQVHCHCSVTLDTLYSLPSRVRATQHAFSQTGGLHAAALFTMDGELVVLREDVGRHNAVDKIIGHALLRQMLPLDQHVLYVTSRASFEIVHKAIAAGLGIMAVVSAPSSLAVRTAREAGMTLVAFLREGRLNVYSREERIDTGGSNI